MGFGAVEVLCIKKEKNIHCYCYVGGIRDDQNLGQKYLRVVANPCKPAR
jgi:hypothetical protein